MAAGRIVGSRRPGAGRPAAGRPVEVVIAGRVRWPDSGAPRDVAGGGFGEPRVSSGSALGLGHRAHKRRRVPGRSLRRRLRQWPMAAARPPRFVALAAASSTPSRRLSASGRVGVRGLRLALRFQLVSVRQSPRRGRSGPSSVGAAAPAPPRRGPRPRTPPGPRPRGRSGEARHRARGRRRGPRHRGQRRGRPARAQAGPAARAKAGRRHDRDRPRRWPRGQARARRPGRSRAARPDGAGAGRGGSTRSRSSPSGSVS